MGYIDSLTKRIQNEVQRYKNRREVARANLMEILTIRHLPLEKMHPNPDDEFSNPAVGANEKIVEKYVKEAMDTIVVGGTCFEKPIMVAKMSDGDYMIVNGHHRWAAAVKVQLNTVRVVITNPGTENLVQYL